MGLGCNYDEVDGDSASMLIDEVATHRNLESLKLSISGNGNRWCVALANLLQNPMSNLTDLNLDCAGIGDDGLVVLGSVLANNTVLKTLTLDTNYGISPTGWLAFTRCLVNSLSNLVNLNLDGNRIGDEGATDLANFLVNNDTMKGLSMRHNQFITPNGWVAFFNRLQTSRVPLKVLDLWGCAVDGDAVVTAMVNFLSNGRSSLRSLNVHTMEFGAVAERRGFSVNGGRAITNLLRSPNSSLEELRFDLNQVNDEVVADLANALVNNASLESLDFDRVQGITKRGWDAFAHILCNTTSIDSIYSSNHTLRNVSSPSTISDLQHLLDLNYNENKADVARQKILQFHFTEENNLQEFVDMELAVLPQALSWIGRDVTSQNGNLWRAIGRNILGFSLMYRSLQSMPSLFDSDGKVEARGVKRMRVSGQE